MKQIIIQLLSPLASLFLNLKGFYLILLNINIILIYYLIRLMNILDFLE